MHFQFDKEEGKEIQNTEIPKTTEHNQMIYRLAVLGKKYNLLIKIGNQETKDKILKPLNKVENLKYAVLKSKQLSYVNQIDCLWFAKKGDLLQRRL